MSALLPEAMPAPPPPARSNGVRRAVAHLIGAARSLSRATLLLMSPAQLARRIALLGRYIRLIASGLASLATRAIVRRWRGKAADTSILLPRGSLTERTLAGRVAILDRTSDRALRDAYLQRLMLDDLDRLLGLPVAGTAPSRNLATGLFGRPLVAVGLIACAIATGQAAMRAGIYTPTLGTTATRQKATPAKQPADSGSDAVAPPVPAARPQSRPPPPMPPLPNSERFGRGDRLDPSSFERRPIP